MINLKGHSPIFERFVYHNESVVLDSIQDAEEGTSNRRTLKSKHPKQNDSC